MDKYNEQCGNIGEARQVAIDALHDYSFNGETYVYLLMGLNHTLKKKDQEVKEGDELRAQVLSLAMTLLHKYRKVILKFLFQ